MVNDIFDKNKNGSNNLSKIKNVLAIQKSTKESIIEKITKRDSLRRGLEHGAAHFPRLPAPAPRPPEPRPPRPTSKLPRFGPCGKGFPVPEPLEPPLVKPRRLGGRLEVRKLVRAGMGWPASDPDS
jgi:hypothetical protein